MEDLLACWSCGAEQSDLEQQYCENCGAEQVQKPRRLLRAYLLDQAPVEAEECFSEAGYCFCLEALQAAPAQEPPLVVRLTAGFRTHPGMEREINEDSLLALQLAALCGPPVHTEFIPTLRPYYGRASRGSFADQNHPTWQADITASLLKMVKRGWSSITWDQVLHKHASPNLETLFATVRASAARTNPEATFSGECLNNLDLDSRWLDYTWNWALFDEKMDWRALVNAYPTPRFNVNVGTSPRAVKQLFMDHLFLNVLPSKPDGINGSARIGDFPDLAKALKTCARLHEQFQSYFDAEARELSVPRQMFQYVEQRQLMFMSMFQYMIGNTDYSIIQLHNVFMLDDAKGIRYTVPYDFDYSGLVGAHYAVPAKGLNLLSVRDRLYRGPCKSEAEVNEALQPFREKQAELLALPASLPDFDDGHRRTAVKYLNEFFELIGRPDRIRKVFVTDCKPPDGM